jgi:hypothetical protein
MATRKIARSSITGRIIKIETARRHPNTTTIETIKTPPKKKD